MRLACFVTLLLFSGCVTTRTQQTRRTAFASLPLAPQALSGDTGVGLALRGATGAPVPAVEGGGVAVPTLQPELGGLLRLPQGTLVGARVAFSMASLGVQSPAELPQPEPGAGAFDFAVGAGHDFKLGERGGLSLSGELGLSGLSLTSVGAFGRDTSFVMMPSGRAAVGGYFLAGPVRLYAGLSLGTGTWNDVVSMQTTTCDLLCSTTETGRVLVTLVGMAGGGVVWRPNEVISLGAELWVPFTSVGTRLPPMLAFTVRLGEFTPGASPPRPLSRPPLPAPAPLPAPESVPAPVGV